MAFPPIGHVHFPGEKGQAASSHGTRLVEYHGGSQVRGGPAASSHGTLG